MANSYVRLRCRVHPVAPVYCTSLKLTVVFHIPPFSNVVNEIPSWSSSRFVCLSFQCLLGRSILVNFYSIITINNSGHSANVVSLVSYIIFLRSWPTCEVYHTCEVISYLRDDKLPVKWQATWEYIIPVQWRATSDVYHSYEVMIYLWEDELPVKWWATCVMRSCVVYDTCEVMTYLWDDELLVKWCEAYHTCEVMTYLWDYELPVRHIIPVRWWPTCEMTSYLYGISYLWSDSNTSIVLQVDDDAVVSLVQLLKLRRHLLYVRHWNQLSTTTQSIITYYTTCNKNTFKVMQSQLLTPRIITQAYTLFSKPNSRTFQRFQNRTNNFQRSRKMEKKRRSCIGNRNYYTETGEGKSKIIPWEHRWVLILVSLASSPEVLITRDISLVSK